MNAGRIVRSAKLDRTGDARTDAGVANSGLIIGDVNLHTGARVRTRYRHQVGRIAPETLWERENELAELREFCVDPATAGSYQWWRAPAWSGKSALMSWFALNPPRKVRIVSFFITARLAGQANRTAFIDNVLEQLLTILDEDLPPLLTASNAEAHLLGLLEEAAHACRDRGESFVLLVDGLDEDRSVTFGHVSHSIAGLLPEQLPAGMRVIVAGRPDPPIPDDVRRHHPLRDPAIVRRLKPSPRAEALRADMEQELADVLHRPTAEQNVLGLLVAAGGGLTSADLAELDQQPPREIERMLNTAFGRNFARRNGHYRTDEDVYLLSHDELHSVAVSLLGDKRVDDYLRRIHEWADDYRRRDWPAESPDYLLHGYFQLLTLRGDFPGMTRCATDPMRQDRMLDVSGGDAAALAEIALTLDALHHSPEPDLPTLARLEVHRHHLANRNAHIPLNLPAAWSAVGHTRRAEALLGAITDADRAVHALVGMGFIAIKQGDPEKAVGHLHDAERRIRSITDPGQAVKALTKLIPLAARVLEPEQARVHIEQAESLIASDVPDRHQQAVLIAQLVRALNFLGDHPRANTLSEFIRSTETYRAEMLVNKVRYLAGSGRLDEAEALARSVRNPERAGWVLANLAAAAAAAGHLTRAEQIARSIDYPRPHGSWALAHVASAVLTEGDVGRAERLVEEITSVNDRAAALSALATTAATTNDGELTTYFATRAEGISRSIVDTESIGSVLAELAEAVSRSGDVRRTRTLSAQAASHLDTQTTMTSIDLWHSWHLLFRALITIGEVDQARALAQNHRSEVALWTLVDALSDFDMVDVAETTADSIADPDHRGHSLVSIAEKALRADSISLVRHLIEKPRGILATTDEAEEPVAFVANFSRSLAIAGHVDLAELVIDALHWDPEVHESLMRSVTTITTTKCDPRLAPALFTSLRLSATSTIGAVRNLLHQLLSRCDDAMATTLARRAEPLVTTLTSLTTIAHCDRAVELCGSALHNPVRAETIVRSFGHRFDQPAVLSAAAQTLSFAKLFQRAEELMESLPAGTHRTDTRITLAAALDAAGNHGHAKTVARRIDDARLQAETLLNLSGDPDMAHIFRLTSRILHSNQWTDALDLLARTHPDALAALADEWLTAHDSRRSPIGDQG